MLFLLLACTDPTPIVSGVQPRPVEAIAAKREAEALRASPTALDAAYKKPDGIYIDARYLCGRTYTAIRDEVETQLGALISERDLPEGGKELVFDRARAQVVEDTITMIEVPLPERLRRTEALAVLGFPPATGDYHPTSGGFRLLNVWGFRRIIFHRAEPGGEDIDRVEVWKGTTLDRRKEKP